MEPYGRRGHCWLSLTPYERVLILLNGFNPVRSFPFPVVHRVYGVPDWFHRAVPDDGVCGMSFVIRILLPA
jgi:hypothetical protein